MGRSQIEVRDGNRMGFAELSPMELLSDCLTPADELYFAEETGQIVVEDPSLDLLVELCDPQSSTVTSVRCAYFPR